MVAQRRVVRAPNPRVLEGAGAVWLFGAGAESCRIEGDSAELVRAILDQADAPAVREDLVARVLDLAGSDRTHEKVVQDAVDLLERMGVLVPAEQLAPSIGAVPGAHVLVGVTGAVGALAAPGLVDRLLAASYEVRVAMTRSARRFVTARAFEALTHQKAATSLWKGTPSAPAPHVELAQWADVVVVYPCTATSIARIAAGDCSELVAAIATATRAPVLLAPSMNRAMLEAPAVAENLAKLRERGFFIAHPSLAIEVAEAPQERIRQKGGAAPAPNVLRYVALLLERALSEGPRVPTCAEWDAEHTRLGARDASFVDPDIARALEAHAPRPSRVLDVGTGTGAVAREAARRGHMVVATDFSEAAIERARAVDAASPVTWLVDDATRSSLRATFDLCIDRGCLGCLPSIRRGRYLSWIARVLRPGGVYVLKVHRAAPANLRAYGFERDEVLSLVEKDFELIEARESTLRFGETGDRPAWVFELRRKAPDLRVGPAPSESKP